jgi:hypothetical protein
MGVCGVIPTFVRNRMSMSALGLNAAVGVRESCDGWALADLRVRVPFQHLGRRWR